jgi:hypothetical protein
LLTLAGLAMIFFIVPLQISSTGDYGLDPKVFPVALLWLIIAMGVLLVATRVPAPPDPADAEPLLDGANWLFIGAFAVFLVLVFIAIKALGFVTAAVLMIAALMLALAAWRPNWIELLCVSMLAPLAIYYALYHVFAVRLPAGDLFP